MPVYLVHHLSKNLEPRAPTRLLDFADKALVEGPDTRKSVASIERYDALRQTIGQSLRGDPRELETPVTAVFSSAEFAPIRTRSDLLQQEIRWAERFDTILIVHAAPTPFAVDGALLYIAEGDPSLAQTLGMSANGKDFFIPRWRPFSNGYTCAARPGDGLYQMKGNPSRRAPTLRVRIRENSAIEHLPHSS